jgi:hypothetical protein
VLISRNFRLMLHLILISYGSDIPGHHMQHQPSTQKIVVFGA